MNKILAAFLTAALIVPSLPAVSAENDTETISYNYVYNQNNGYLNNTVHTRKMEKLDRGLIAIKSGNGAYLSWRLFDSEDTVYGSAESNVEFNVYRNGTKIATVSDTTNYTDTTAGASYSVAPVIDGKEDEKCEAVSVRTNSYFDIPLVKPADETIYEGDTPATKSFSPTDCSAGDLDGDGEYEIVVKWTSQECDVGNGGYSGTVRFGAYKLDGTKLWSSDINLGKNVYSSAHTAQFLVYDFDGDGKSEMMVQTSLGSTDAKGKYVSHAAKADSVVASTGKKIAEYTDEENVSADFNGYDRKVSGEEFLTVFNGETGEAIDTIDLPTTRGNAKGVDYGDDFGNRSNRFIASVAYLDGVKPYAVYLRGYYFGKNGKQRTSIAGISFDGQRLSPDYRFDTQEKTPGYDKDGEKTPGYYDGAYQYVGQGNHNCTVADVDNDGKDEFITGALCMEVKDDNSFKPRWCTYLQHGDALHIGDYDPTRTGLEFFTVHEDDGTNTLGPTPVTMDFGMSVIDANTGEIIFHKGADGDTGRGVMANTGSGGYYQITGVGSYQCNGGKDFTETANGAGSNFRIFWDGDLCDELLDGVKLTNWNSSSKTMEREVLPTNTKFYAINGTKSNPALQADLFGDWREEIIYPTNDGNYLRVFSTTTASEYKIKTLMHDPVYRSGVAAEQTAYNQPPHVGFYMDTELFDEITYPSTPKPTKPETNTLYERGTDDIAWTQTDVQDWTQNGEIKLAYGNVGDKNGLIYDAIPSSSYSATKTFNASDDALTINYDVDWHFGSQPVNTKKSGNNYEYIQFGDNFRFGWDRNYKVWISADGGNTYSETSVAAYGNNTQTKNIQLSIDLKTNTITSISFADSELTGYIGTEIINPKKVTFGLQQGEQAPTWNVPIGISKIIVTQTLPMPTPTPSPTATPAVTTTPTPTESPAPTPTPTVTPTSAPDAGYIADYNFENKYATIHCNIDKKDTVVIFASYDGGKLVSIQTVKMDLQKDTDRKPMASNFENGEKVKIFVWESLEKPIPIMEAKEFNRN